MTSEISLKPVQNDVLNGVSFDSSRQTTWGHRRVDLWFSLHSLAGKVSTFFKQVFCLDNTKKTAASIQSLETRVTVKEPSLPEIPLSFEELDQDSVSSSTEPTERVSSSSESASTLSVAAPLEVSPSVESIPPLPLEFEKALKQAFVFFERTKYFKKLESQNSFTWAELKDAIFEEAKAFYPKYLANKENPEKILIKGDTLTFFKDVTALGRRSSGESYLMRGESYFMLCLPIGSGGHKTVYFGIKLSENLVVAISHLEREDEERFHKLWCAMFDFIKGADEYDGLSKRRILTLFDQVLFKPAFTKGNWVEFVASEYCEKGDLERFIRKEKENLTPQDRKRILIEVGEGTLLIRMNILDHGDLKPDNFFVKEDGSICIADFGYTMYEDAANRSGYGNLWWSAPKYLLRKTSIYNEVWPVALMWLHVLLGRAPVYVDQTYDLIKEYEKQEELKNPEEQISLRRWLVEKGFEENVQKWIAQDLDLLSEGPLKELFREILIVDLEDSIGVSYALRKLRQIPDEHFLYVRNKS